MHKGIGLCGAHRTGKTTIATTVAEQYPLALVRTSTSEVFARHGIDPARPMDFATRLWIQDKILAAATEVWQAQSSDFITDRTPLDMLAYTMADVRGETEVDDDMFQRYSRHCFQANTTFFHHLFVVQPGIPLVKATGKAALNKSYIDHLNTLIIGLCAAEEQPVPYTVMPRHLLDLSERCRLLMEKCPLPLT